jgi:hypothetical protein
MQDICPVVHLGYDIFTRYADALGNIREKETGFQI